MRFWNKLTGEDARQTARKFHAEVEEIHAAMAARVTELRDRQAVQEARIAELTRDLRGTRERALAIGAGPRNRWVAPLALGLSVTSLAISVLAAVGR
jgi:hypothetical protein